MGVFELKALRLDEFVTILCFCSTIYAMFAGYKNVTRKHKGNYFVIALFCHTLYYRTLVVIAIIYESVIYSICPRILSEVTIVRHIFLPIQFIKD